MGYSKLNHFLVLSLISLCNKIYFYQATPPTVVDEIFSYSYYNIKMFI